MTYRAVMVCNICGYKSENVKEFISVSEKLVVEIGIRDDVVRVDTEMYLGHIKADKHLCYKCFSSVLKHIADAAKDWKTVSPQITIKFIELEVQR